MRFTAILFTVLVLAPCVAFGTDDFYCVCLGVSANKAASGGTTGTPFAAPGSGQTIGQCPTLMPAEASGLTESNGCACLASQAPDGVNPSYFQCLGFTTASTCENMCVQQRGYGCSVFTLQDSSMAAPSNTLPVPPGCQNAFAPLPPVLCPGTFTVTFAALTTADCDRITTLAQIEAPGAVFICNPTSRTLTTDVEDGCIDYTTTIIPPMYQKYAEGLIVEEFKGVCENQCGVPKGSTCFPADAVVELEDGMTLRMDALKVGHKVRVGPKEHSEVFMFSHQYTDAQATFVKLQTATGAIQLTESHYLFVNGKAAQASTVKVGDLLETATGAPAAVTGISTVRATGLYNPHTMQGDIIVNGIRTSTYTDAITPTLAHAMLAPIRALYSMNVTIA